MKLKAFVYFTVMSGVLCLCSCQEKQIPKQQPKEKKVSQDTISAFSNKKVKPTPDEKAKVESEKELGPAKVPSPTSPTAPESSNQHLEIPSLSICQAPAPVVEKKIAQKEYQRSEPKLSEGTITELAKQTGFAARLPKEMEIYIGYQGIDKLIESMFKSKIAKALNELAGGNLEFDDIKDDRDYREFMNIAGEEIFISGGENSAQLLTGFAKIFSGVMQHELRGEHLRMIARMEGVEDYWSIGRGEPKFITSREGAFKVLQNLQVAPVYAGFKISDKERRQELVEMMQNGLVDLMNEQPKEKPFMTAVKSEVEGGFTGIKISGKDLVKTMKGGRTEKNMIKDLGRKFYDEWMLELAKHEVVLMVGVVDDYIVMHAGKSAEGLTFAKSAEQSVLARPKMKFAKNYADKKIIGLAFLSDSAMQELNTLKAEIPAMATAYADALSESDYFGDTREIQDLIKETGKKGAFLFDLLPKSRLGSVMYLEDGLKMENYLGKDSVVFDLDSTRKLAAMASHTGATISGNWVLKPEFSKQTSELLEVATNATYKILKIAVEQDVHDDEWLEFATNFRVADSEFSSDLVRLWKSFQTGLLGLSNEHAIMVDLNGRMPSGAKQVPEALRLHGAIPRIAYANNVLKRSTLATTWGQMAAAAKDIGNGIGKIVKKDITLPKPTGEKKAGLSLWSYTATGMDKDVNPTLGLNDKLFYLTTSPDYIQALSKQKTEAVKPGAELVIRMAPIRSAANHWLKVLDNHGKKFLSSREWEEFQAMKPMFKNLIEASNEVKEIDIFTRKVDGEIRNSIHLNTQ